MKILIISRYPPFPGGRENFVLELAEELSKQHEIIVLTPDQNNNTQSDNLIIKKNPNNKEVLKKIIIDFNPDVINSHTFYLSKDAFDVAKKLNILFGITLHGDQFAIGDKQRQELVSEICLDSEFIINVSENGKESILKNIKAIKSEKLFVIKNGVNLEKFKKGTDLERNKYRKELNIENNKKVILIPTRIAPYKGLEFLIKMIIKNKWYLIKKDILIETKKNFSNNNLSFIDIILENNICTFLFHYHVKKTNQSLLKIGEFDGEIYLKKEDIFSKNNNLIPNIRLESISNFLRKKWNIKKQ